MKKLRRFGSSFARLLRGAWSGRGQHSASALRSASGSVHGRGFEALEQRQLMFALTITPSDVDPTTGLGLTKAFFAYSIPVLDNDVEILDVDPSIIDEDLNDEFPVGGVLQAVTNVPSGRVLIGSFIRVVHNIRPAANMQVRQIGTELSERQFHVRLDTLDQFLEFQPGTQTGSGVAATSYAFDVGAGANSNVGLSATNMKVELFLSGVVIDTFTGARLLAQNTTFPGTGVGRFVFNAPQTSPAFTAIRITAIGAPNDEFTIDNITQVLPAGRFSAYGVGRIFGTEVTFAGPVGASVQFFDLYGRDMRESIALGQEQNSQVPLNDLNDDGVPEFNDGIGRVVISGGDSRTALTLTGGRVAYQPGAPDPEDEFNEQGFSFNRIETLSGFIDEFEAAGFCFDFADDGTPLGLPPTGASVIIGSPWVRDNTSGATYNAGGLPAGFNAPVSQGFLRSDQGIFAENGQSLGSVVAHAILMGSSHFDGAVDKLNIGYPLGTVSVDGDLGAFVSAVDAGRWTGDDDDNTVKTGAQLIIGRSVGEIAIGGRMSMEVTIAGDLNAPTTKPARGVYEYFEKEFILGIDPAAESVVAISQWIANTAYSIFSDDRRFRTIDQPYVFGSRFMRNDNLMNAEWIGSLSTGVRIAGDLSGRDPISSGDDNVDVFAFASDATTPIVIQIEESIANFTYFRLVDSDGRTLASLQQSLSGGEERTLRYQPDTPGVYYLVVADPTDGAAEDAGFGTLSYAATVLGMAPSTLGALRIGAHMGVGDGEGNAMNSGLTLLSGSIGSIRMGVGINNAAGGETSPAEAMNGAPEDADTLLDWVSGTISAPGSIYNITTGSDISGTIGSPINVIVGGDFGSMITGQSNIIGLGPIEGDVNSLRLRVGGRIASIDIRGGVGIDQDVVDPTDPATPGLPGSVLLQTGTAGLGGDIGMVRLGSHIANDALSINTPANSIIGAILVSQDVGLEGEVDEGVYSGQQGILTNLGVGSDVRFVNFPKIDLLGGVSVTFPIIAGQILELQDDGGGVVRFRVANSANGLQIGTVNALPINNSRGVAISQIDIDITNGAELIIEGDGTLGQADVISIGRINVIGSTNTSNIRILGDIQVDVWRIDAPNGLGLIRNDSPFGDIVSADVNSLTQLSILSGDLGKTQVPAWGPQLIGPFIGVANGPRPVTPPGAPLMDDDWNGAAYRPIASSLFGGANAYLDDIGSPIDPYLNGVVVRTGTVASVLVGGQIGDVLVPQGDITLLQANVDRTTPTGRFDGITGNIYALTIDRVDIGDGLAARNRTSPFATTSIVAIDDILNITNDINKNANIESVIVAGNQTFGNRINDGIDTIKLTGGGDYLGANISASNLDNFWLGFFYGDDNRALGNINSLGGEKADFFRCEVLANDLILLELRDGAYDASYTSLTGDIGTIRAAEFRNSTLVGGDLEFRLNAIIAAGNLRLLQTTNKLGDISDLAVDIKGDVQQEISARNITRSQFDVDNFVPLLEATEDIRASTLNAGNAKTVKAGGNISGSRLLVAGIFESLSATDSIINTEVGSTGPFGRIDSVKATNVVSGTIYSAGPIKLIESTAGDVRVAISTNTSAGNVETVRAARDLDITTDIAGTLTTLQAGRHIGSANGSGAIVIRGSLKSAKAIAGQLYSDIRVGQTIDVIEIGKVSATPTLNLLGSGSIYAFGAINSVKVTGDFNGNVVSYSGGITSVTITDGSYLPGNTISAFEGSVLSVVITNGHLLGNVHADNVISEIRVVASSDGVFGDIGVNPALSSGQGTSDPLRNQLPPGVVQIVAAQGPKITAGNSITRITTTGGSLFEASIIAGRSIGAIEINGRVGNDFLTTGFGTIIGAGDVVNSVAILGNGIDGADASDMIVMGGLVDFGNDGALAGRQFAKDTIRVGGINNISIAGNATRVAVTAGMNAGADGIYNTADDTVVTGISYVSTVVVVGTVTNVSVFSDNLGNSITADSRILTGGPGFANAEPLIDVGFGNAGAPITAAGLAFTWGTASGTIFFSGGGEAFWDSAAGRVTLRNTNSGSALSVSVNAAQPTLTGFDIVTNDDASLGTLNIVAHLAGDSDIVIDGNIGSLSTGHIEGSGTIIIGGDADTLVFGNFRGGTVIARFVQATTFGGDFGGLSPSTRNEAKLQYLSAGGIAVNGTNRGVVSVDQDILGFTNGATDVASVRAGGSIGNFIVSGAMSRTWLSARDNIIAVTIGGDMFDSSIMGGADLGLNAEFGGTNLSADRVTTGTIGSVTVGGSFRESDIAAGVIRGADGFFGTSDDLVAEGRSSIGTVKITGAASGSNRNSEAYRIVSTGTLGSVTAAGVALTGSGNFKVERLATTPLPFEVDELSVSQDALVYSARLQFNQPVDFSSFARGLAVSEVRGTGQVEIRLINGVDYTLSYETATNTVVVTFARAVTTRSLPQFPGRPGPGVYRFALEQATTRAQLVNTKLDGNQDGRSPLNDNYSEDDLVGDIGDKATANTVTVTSNGQAVHTIDFYAAANLDILLDDNRAPDGVPDANRDFTVRGAIGDHPDNDANYFRYNADTDVFRLTLQAGQILRLGNVGGAALDVFRNLYDVNGVSMSALDPSGAAVTLPVNDQLDIDQNLEQAFLIKRTGTYFLVVGEGTDFINPVNVPDPAPTPGTLGEYSFSLTIFDDGDSGFGANTDAGNGANVASAPDRLQFAGIDGIFNTADDLTTISSGSFSFTLDNGADGVRGTVDDVVGGSDTTGKMTSTRTETSTSAGRAFTLVSTIDAAIGPAGHAGAPQSVAADVDIFHLNNRLTIATGAQVTVTVKLNDLGADLGSRLQFTSDGLLALGTARSDYRGQVQLGVFDTTTSVATDDALLVVSPTEFLPTGSTPGVSTTGDNSTYGYDANGDFFVRFTAPGRQDGSGLDASYAVYLQGVFNTDYRLEVSTALGATQQAIVKKTQNILLETRGGTIDWLEVAGQTTDLAPFASNVLGFTGAANDGRPIDLYILEEARDQLQATYDAAGLNINISLDPSEFERDEYSTVFLTTTDDVVSLIFADFDFASFIFNNGGAFSSTNPFGFSEKSDPLNTDLGDEAVVFLPSFGLLGFTPSQTDVDTFVSSVAGSVGRRIGELMGLRISADVGDATIGDIDIQSADSPTNTPGNGEVFTLTNTSRPLSDSLDSITATDFFLGRQNSRGLLQLFTNT